MILEKQSIASGYIPSHKIKSNFLDFYCEFVKNNARYGSRHLMSSYNHFKSFLGTDYISAMNVSENFCENFRAFLLKKFNGETPANYFREFKKMLKAAKKAGYFVENPAEDIVCKTKPNKIKKEVIEPQEYLQLLKTLTTNIQRDGTRIDSSSIPVNVSNFDHYGYQFWLNMGKSKDTKTRFYPHVPDDMYFADRFRGQNLFNIHIRIY